MKQINLEEILKSKINEAIGSTTILNEFEFNIKKDGAIIDAMKEACKQVLELAAENVKLYSYDKNGNHLTNGNKIDVNNFGGSKIDKHSILNTINQVK